jgi:hypothetical protein
VLTRGSNGVVRLTFTPTCTCAVEAATNLSYWQTVFATNDVSSSTPLLQFTDTDATNFPTRFYRLAETFAGAPMLTDWSCSNRAVTLGYVAAPVQTCAIMASTNLMNWATLFSTNLPAPAPFQFRFDGPADLPVRFYRLSQTPGF